MNDDQKAELLDPADYDNEVLKPEEMAYLLYPIPITIVAQLCKEINEDGANGYY